MVRTSPTNHSNRLNPTFRTIPKDRSARANRLAPMGLQDRLVREARWGRADPA
jgi:hypothetical protein